MSGYLNNLFSINLIDALLVAKALQKEIRSVKRPFEISPFFFTNLRTNQANNLRDRSKPSSFIWEGRPTNATYRKLYLFKTLTQTTQGNIGINRRHLCHEFGGLRAVQTKKLWTEAICLKKLSSKNYGFTILETMVTLGILSVAMLALIRVNGTAMKSNKSAGIRSELLDVKRTIDGRLSCQNTLGAARPTACSGSVTLKDKNNSALIPSNRIGEWTIEAVCEWQGSPSANGLSIYATKPGKIDPLRNLPLDKRHPISALYKPEVRPCQENFTATPPEGGLVPVGGIVMWSGSPWNVPLGWALCNGGSGTPDLRDRFIVGAGGGYSTGQTGGATQVTLDANTLPSHSHGASGWVSASASTSTSFDGYNSYVDVGRGEEQARMAGCIGASCGAGWRSVAVRPLGVNVNVAMSGVGVAVGASGNSQPFDIRPPFYSVAFIMKLP